MAAAALGNFEKAIFGARKTVAGLSDSNRFSLSRIMWEKKITRRKAPEEVNDRRTMAKMSRSRGGKIPKNLIAELLDERRRAEKSFLLASESR